MPKSSKYKVLYLPRHKYANIRCISKGNRFVPVFAKPNQIPLAMGVNLVEYLGIIVY